jgi:hypothetical protein
MIASSNMLGAQFKHLEQIRKLAGRHHAEAKAGTEYGAGNEEGFDG